MSFTSAIKIPFLLPHCLVLLCNLMREAEMSARKSSIVTFPHLPVAFMKPFMKLNIRQCHVF